jgi:hypothetical protein
MGNKEFKRKLRLDQAKSLAKQQKAQIKEQRRAEKNLIREKSKQLDIELVPKPVGAVHVACLIHSDGYSWEYVEKLENMVRRNLSREVIFHVYTEESRPVPEHITKHVLEEWPGQWGARKSWWYKLQLFNPAHFAGPLLYFDLDTVIVKNIDWITELPLNYFWAPRDYRYIWKPNHQGINSSVMWWDTNRFDYVYREFMAKDLQQTMRHYKGDQDYITEAIPPNSLRYFMPMNVMSWRWQCLHGGIHTSTRTHISPGAGTVIDHKTSVLVFHGDPKPHAANDTVIENFWR